MFRINKVGKKASFRTLMIPSVKKHAYILVYA